MGNVEDEKNSNIEESKESKKAKDISMTKVIMRRLPPMISESDLLEQIAPLPPYDYFSFVPADMTLSPWAYSRAYFHLTSMDDVILFRDRFDGYIFMDPKGNEYQVMVELAPSQKIPSKKHKKDPKCGTIEQDAAYQKFLEEVQNPKVIEMPNIASTLAEIEKRDKELKESRGNFKMKTPLIEFLVLRREEKRKKIEEKRKQKETERLRREEEHLRRIETEKAHAKKQKILEEERQKEAENRLNEKFSEASRQSTTAREKAPRFTKKQSTPSRQKWEPTEHGVKKSDTEKSKFCGLEKRTGLSKKKPTEKKDRFFSESEEFSDQPKGSKDKKSQESHEFTDKKTFAEGKMRTKASKYKDKPSAPIYQPSQRRKQLETTEKLLVFKDVDENL